MELFLFLIGPTIADLTCAVLPKPKTNVIGGPIEIKKSSIYKGVFWDPTSKGGKPWRALIRIQGRLTHLGRFASQEEAATAYDCAAYQFHGDHARPNLKETIA